MTSPKPRGPIETKLFAGVGGVAIGKPISDVILWCCGVWVWNAPNSGPKSDVAGGFVPLPWRGLIEWLVPVILGAVAYYWAPHTHRPDLATEVPASHLDERIATPLEHIDALVTEKWERDKVDMHATTPIKPVPSPDMGLRIMDEAHD